jgi:amidase
MLRLRHRFRSPHRGAGGRERKLTGAEFDRLGAFVPGAALRRPAEGGGPLEGLSFAVKDLIDTAGVATGAGNPDWARTHEPATRDAPCVAALLREGARLCGKTVTDELAFSLEGANHHYGTPLNPRAPERLPGGSSSGSASAVAGGAVDFALGTDTGGSVRAPAAFCGLLGLRPTHGAVSLEGVTPFAPSYDTVGLLAREAGILDRAARALLGPPASFGAPRLLIAEDAFALSDEPVRAALRAALPQALREARQVTALEGGPEVWLEAYRVLQGWEIWRSLGEWIERIRPGFGPSIRDRFADAATITDAEAARWRPWRARARDKLTTLLGADGVLIIPTTPTLAPLKTASAAEIGAFYARTLPFTSIASHCGTPQVTIPLCEAGGVPVGLSLIGPPGADLALLSFARNLDNNNR